MNTQHLKLVLAALLAAAVLPSPASAKHNMNIKLDSSDIRHGDVTVAKGETRHGDVVATGSIKVYGTVQGDCASLGGSVTVAGEVHGDVAALGGSADVTGLVTGDLAVLGGTTHISGKVNGEIGAMGGDVTLDKGAEVGGDLSTLGGKLNQADGAVVRGKISNKDLGLAKLLLPLASKIKDVPAAAETLSPFKRVIEFAMFCVFAAGMGAMILFLAVFAPQNVEATAAMIKRDFWKCGGMGALILMLTCPALLLMTVSIIGIPLVPVALLVYCAGVFMALAACGLVLANRLAEVRGQAASTCVTATAQGYGFLIVLFVVGKFFRLAGGAGALLGGLFVFTNLLLMASALVVGLGAVWLTRMGTLRGVAAVPAGVPPPPAAK